ncbi:MAG: ornithine cyclodeaminase family protein [Geminicoccaceae bacterium]
MDDHRGDSFLMLSDETLAGLGVPVAAIVDAVEAAIRSEAAGKIWTAPKSAVLPGDGRYMMSTLSTSDDPDMTVVKSVMVSPRNPERGLPGVEGNIILQDSETGQLRAGMQAGWVTAVRTAGLSAVVARKMADPKSKTIAFIGCGVQARSHLEMFAELFPLKEIRAYGRGQANIDRLCRMAEEHGMATKVCDTPRETLEGADLVVSSVTFTFDREPFVDARWLPKGAFATITDIAAPWVTDGMAAFGAVIIDDQEQERVSQKKMVDPGLVRGDLRGLIADDADIAFDPEKRSAFIFRGLAIGDFAIASLAYERACAAAKGTSVRW